MQKTYGHSGIADRGPVALKLGHLLSFRIRAFAVIVAAVVLTAGGLVNMRPGMAPIAAATGAIAHSGSAACAACHVQEFEAWSHSQHARAMADASANNILGDFGSASAESHGSTALFSQRGGRFFVTTDDKDGKSAEFQIKNTFGIEPLQQYLAALPDGRLQALPFAWNTRAKGEGGQRWFHLYPDRKIAPTDELHWTGRQQNWNYMCAECHSTAVRKGYEATTNSFNTTFAEISVGCEARHGAGGQHVA